MPIGGRWRLGLSGWIKIRLKDGVWDGRPDRRAKNVGLGWKGYFDVRYVFSYSI